MNKISDKLFLGNLKAASDLNNLKKNVSFNISYHLFCIDYRVLLIYCR